MYNALVLAGSDKEKNYNKALICVNRKPIISYVLNALKESKEIDKIVVIGPRKDFLSLIEDKSFEILDQEESLLNNLEKGINFLDSERKIFISSSDIPLITPFCVDEFLKKCQKEDFGAFYPIMKKENILKKYPDTQRTYLKLKEGYFCGGNFVVINREIFQERKDLFREAIKNKKNVIKLAKFFGLKTILKFLFKVLTLKELERKVSEIIGFKVCAVEISCPEAMIDFDKKSDLDLIEKNLKPR